MIKVGSEVSVHTFAWNGRLGMVEGVSPSVPFGPNVRTVAMASVRVYGRETWMGREADTVTTVPLVCVSPA